MSAPFDLVIRGGTVYDGSGAAPSSADVAIRGARIAAVGPNLTSPDARCLDAAGLAVAPGFVDVHSHDDYALVLQPELPFKVLQGVTTVVVGNCGSGVAPFAAGLARFRRYHPNADPTPWDGYGGYVARLEQQGMTPNAAVLVGHGTLRRAAMGLRRGPPTAAELDRMLAWLREGLAAGAVGFSTSLMSEPGCYAQPDEIVALARELARWGGVYASHLRNEAEGLLEAVREALAIGEAAGVPVQLSHHKAAGRRNWGSVQRSLALIDAARARGLDVALDQYPYTAGSNSLHAVVQSGALRSAAESGMGQLAPEQILIASAPAQPADEGRTLAELAAERGCSAEVMAEQLLARDGEALMVVLFMMDEADVRTVLAHPLTMIGSDGIPAAGSRPHPRLYGTFPRVLGHYVRDQPVLELATAVQRMTGLPAARFGLAGRGRIAAGAFADLTIFDPAEIKDRATYQDPCRTPDGIQAVFVNGQLVAREGRHTWSRPGRVLRYSVA